MRGCERGQASGNLTIKRGSPWVGILTQFIEIPCQGIFCMCLREPGNILNSSSIIN